MPNYDGTVNKFEADSGKIEEVLSGLMTSRKLTGKVVHEASTDAKASSATLSFKIENPGLKICEIQFPGALPGILSAFNEITHWLIDTPYSKYDVNQSITSGLIPIFKEHGYLRVKIGSHIVNLVDESKCKGGISIDIPVQQGALYGFENVIWSNHQILSEKELGEAWTMKRGDVPSQGKVGKATSSLYRAYMAKGFMGMKHQKEMDIDDAQLKYTYKISVNEGPQYRMGKFVSKVLSDADVQKLADKCKLKSGDFFTGAYMQEFMSGKLDYDKFTYEFDADHESRIVNIEIKKKD